MAWQRVGHAHCCCVTKASLPSTSIKDVCLSLGHRGTGKGLAMSWKIRVRDLGVTGAAFWYSHFAVVLPKNAGPQTQG